MRNIDEAEQVAIRESVTRLHQYLMSLARRMSLRDPMHNAWAEEECPPAQARTVMWLGNDGPLTMGDFAQRMSVSEKTVTGIVDRCEKDGYLRRERNEDDRRIVRCVLTSVGDALHQRLESLFVQKMTKMMGLLDADDREAMFRVLDKLALRLFSDEQKSNDIPNELQEKT